MPLIFNADWGSVFVDVELSGRVLQRQRQRHPQAPFVATFLNVYYVPFLLRLFQKYILLSCCAILLTFTPYTRLPHLSGTISSSKCLFTHGIFPATCQKIKVMAPLYRSSVPVIMLPFSRHQFPTSG